MSNLAARVWSGVVLGAIFIAVTIAGGTPFVMFITLIAAIFWVEWTDMKMPGSDDRLQPVGILGLIALAVVILFAPPAAKTLLLLAVLALFAVAAVGLKDRRAIGGFVYAALLLTSLGLLRGDWGFEPGLAAIIFLVAVVWATDIGAYFVGRRVGGPKLAPRVSPNKTISGALGGLASAVAAALLVDALFGVSSFWAAIGLALVLSTLSQAGDLFESWIKRRAGVKDSGRVIPGHGGVMDRVDGLVFAAIGLWFASALRAGIDQPALAFFLTDSGDPMFDFLTGLVATDGFIIGIAVPFLFVLTVVIFFHELGHYLVGRWCGIGAKVFSVGFGPELFGFDDRHGTRWRLSAIPLGGYVKFVGDMNAASASATMDDALTEAERARAFHTKSVWRRAATVFAGPAANFILAIVIFAFVLAVFGRVVADPVVAEVRAGSAAEAAGLEAGDRFVSLDGQPVASFSDVQRYVAPRAGSPIAMVVDRDGQSIDLTITPERLEIEDRFGNRIEQGVIGVVNNPEAGRYRTETYPPLQAVWLGVQETGYVISRTGGYLAGVITGRESADQIGGPIRVAQVSGQVATLGFIALLNLTAILSVSIGLLNLLPVPVLDGGHLMFYAYEAVRGKPLSEVAQEYGYRIGFALVLGLMVFATWNDITILFGNG